MFLGDFLLGIRAALSLPTTIVVVYQSRTIQRNFLQCVILNGVILAGSILLFDHVVLRFLHLFAAHLLPRLETAQVITDIVDWIMISLYYLLWAYPLYAISLILNGIWYSEIAYFAYLVQEGRPDYQPASYKGFVGGIADEIYRLLLVAFFLAQITLLSLLPFGVGQAIMFVGLSLLYAFYCFDYKWNLQGANIDERMAFFESNWAFMTGFGAPFTALTLISPNLVVQGALFALLFPVYIIMANAALPRPIQSIKNPTGKAMRLPVFQWARSMNGLLFKSAERRRVAAHY